LRRLYGEDELPGRLEAFRQKLWADIEAAVESALPDEPKLHVQLRTGRPYEQICAAAAEGRFDLLVLGPHKGSDSAELGHTAARVAHNSPCSVLVVR
jgi:nucleotide-binding universal stress UspA family protein